MSRRDERNVQGGRADARKAIRRFGVALGQFP
jgi:hypothetical protein